MRNGNDSGESGDQYSSDDKASGKGRSEGRKNHPPLSPLAIDALCDKLFDPSVPLLGHESPADDAAAASMLRCPEVLGSFIMLQPAYVWYCPCCGQENYAKCDVVKFTEEQKDAIREAYGECNEDHFQVSPDTVCCKNCGSQFDSLDEDEWDANEESEFAGGVEGGDDDDGEDEDFGEETEWDRYKAGAGEIDDDGEGYFEIRDASPDEDQFQEFDPEGDFDDEDESDFDEDFDDDFADADELLNGQQTLPIFAGEENGGEVMPPELDGESGDEADGKSNNPLPSSPAGQNSRRSKSDDGRNSPLPPYTIGETHWWVDNPFGIGWNPPGV